MNYYPFHIGDYTAATVHLAPLEDLAYRRLLDLYYDMEGPIPLETQWVIRRLRLGSESVIPVLEEFFIKQADGWHNLRCDEEIRDYKRMCEKNKANGKLGGRPKKTQSVILANPELTQTKANQNQNQNQSKEETPLSGKAPDVLRINGYKAEATEILVFLNTKTGRNYRPVESNLRMIAARLREGASVIDCRQVIAKKCRDWSTNQKMEPFLRPATLFNATNFAQYVGELGQLPSDVVYDNPIFGGA